MTPERAAWWVVLGPLCALLALSLIFGVGAVSAAFEAVFDGIAWVVLVWLAMLGFI
jgi:hypothetical protein